MAGVAGRGGPPPKRTGQRRRRNAPAGGEVTVAAGAESVVVPDPDPAWHPIARRWYTALGESGQARFYEPSDWATAYLLAEAISRDLAPQVVGIDPESGEPVTATVPIRGAALSAYLKAMTALLACEGDRRRARLELRRPDPDGDGGPPAGVAALDEYRAVLAG